VSGPAFATPAIDTHRMCEAATGVLRAKHDDYDVNNYCLV